MYSLLEGITIIDCSRLLPGPLCTMFLADLGAEVIKIEQPGVGDLTRWIHPMQSVEGVGFLALNRNKKSVALDLSRKEGRSLFMRMIPTADVLVESFRPGVASRLGMDYATLSKVNPRLVYASLTGFGQTGPLAARADHDLNYCALSGLLSLFCRAGEKPVIPPVQLADIGGGSLPAVIGILAALLRRTITGRGDHVDISMLEGVMTWMSVLVAARHAVGRDPQPGEGFLAGESPCYGIYETKDGRFLTVGAIEPKFWQTFIEVIELPELAERQFDAGDEGRSAQALVQAKIGTKTVEEWYDRFKGLDACVEPVLTLSEALSQPHLEEKGLLIDLQHPTEGHLQQIGCPIRFASEKPHQDMSPPQLGEHTREILLRFGSSPEEIAQLKQLGIVG